MLVIAIMTIVAFIWLYNRTNLTQVGSNDVARVYGRVVQRAQLDLVVRGYQLALALGLTDFVKDLGGLGANEEMSLNEFVTNLFVIQHEAPRLGIRPSDDEVASMIRTLAPLQTDGVFDPAKYAAFIQEQLAPRGYTERQMEEMIRDSIRVRELHRVITSPVASGESDVREAAHIYQPVNVQILRFDREAYLKDVVVTSEEVASFYSRNSSGMTSPERRTLSYAVLELSPALQNGDAKEKTKALQNLADKAVAAGKSIREGVAKGLDFAKLASGAGLNVKITPALDRNGAIESGKDQGVPKSLVAAAFRLKKSGEISDIIQDGSAFYIVTVNGITPARQLELAEISEKLTSLLKSQKASKLCSDASTASLEQIRVALSAGKSFAEAAKQAKIKTQQLTGLVPSDRKNNQEQQAIAEASLGLKEGALSQLLPAPWGNFAVYLEKRAPLTDEQWKDHQASLSKSILSSEQDLLFDEWLHQSRALAKIQVLGGHGGAQ